MVRDRNQRQRRQVVRRIVYATVLFGVLVGFAASGIVVLQAVGFAVLGVAVGLAIGDPRPLVRLDARAWRDAVAAIAVGALVVLGSRVTAGQAFTSGAVGLLAGLLWAAQDPGVFAKLLGLSPGRIDDGMAAYRRRRTLSDMIADEMAGGQRPPTELPPLRSGPDPDAPLDLTRQLPPESPRPVDAIDPAARLARVESELKDARWRIRTLQDENQNLMQELAVASAKGAQDAGSLRLKLQEAEARVRRCEERLAEAERAAQTRLAERPTALALALTPAPTAEGASDRRFQEVKRTFARRFHPDFVNADGMERALRIDLFKEFWGDLERIERGQDA